MVQAYTLEAPVLLTTVLVPIAVATVVALLRLEEKASMILNTAGLAYMLGVLAFLHLRFVMNGVVVNDPTYLRVVGLGGFSMRLDAISSPFALAIALVTTMVALYSLPYMRHRFEEMGAAPGISSYYFLYTLFSASMVGTVLATNLVEFYVFLELTLLPSFLLIAFYGYGDRIRIAIMYLLWTHIGALALLIGILVIGLYSRTFDIYGALETMLPQGLRLPVMALILFGLLVKMAVFGVHIWLPYAHAEAPTPISALLSPNLIGIAAYVMIRFMYTMMPRTFFDARWALYAWALVTMVYGGLMALAQDDFKRFLAYSSVSQMGYLLLGIASFTGAGLVGATLHYVSHAVGKALLFMTAGVFITNLHGLRSISKMGGLVGNMPLTFSMALVGVMHITGVPPSLGLWSEIFIVMGAATAAMASQNTAIVALAAIGLIVAIGLSTAYAFLAIKRIFYGPVREELREARDPGPAMLASMAVIMAFGLLMFLWPGILLNPLKDLAALLSH